jgi:hypothetical protein
MMRSRSLLPALRRALVVSGLLGAGLAPASAQWLGVLPEGPIPPGNIVRSLMSRGFLEVGRPRFIGDAYVVEGVNARGMRLRLIVDAYDGSLVSRTRLDQPLLPPGNVGRDRVARVEPFGEYHGPSFDEEEIVPRRWNGPPIDRDALPPPPVGRRAERAEPLLMEPHRPLPPNAARPVEPGGAAPPQQRQARKVEPAARQPSASAAPQTKGKKVEPQAVPAAPVEAAKPETLKEPPAVAAAAPTPSVKQPQPAAAPAPETPGDAKPAEQGSSPRSVRVIGGVTPMRQQAQTRDPLELPKPDVPPPVTID